MLDIGKLHAFPSDNLASRFLDDQNLFENEDEIENQFYNDLLARASKNANRPSYRQQHEESLLDSMLLHTIRNDDYPIWKIKCKVRQMHDIQ